MLVLAIAVSIVLIISTTITFRVITLLPIFEELPVPKHVNHKPPDGPIRITIVLGSGGHTAEMLTLLQNLDITRYTHRSYVISSGDGFSAQKAQEFEAALDSKHGGFHGSYDIAVVPRARRIHQSLLTTPISALVCLLSCVKLLRKPDLAKQPLTYPNVIITNGPGTGVIVVIASYLVRMMSLGNTKGPMRTVYVESWARVRRLSLSGRILLPLVNRFIVQWEVLAKTTGGKAEFLGVLV